MRAARLAGVVAVPLLLAGCAALPTSGPVEVAEGGVGTTAPAPFDFNPPGPAPGAPPEEIAAGFVNALQATPVSTRVATEYLTEDARRSWRPGNATVVYETQQVEGRGDVVEVSLDGAYALDDAGRWRGAADQATVPEAEVGAPGGPGGGASVDLRLRLVLEEGQWRVDNPPDALLVPQSHFLSRYQTYAIHFFDRTGRVLVPEVVHLPVGVQTPSALVTALLGGPARTGQLAEQSFFPAGTRLEPSVPVSRDGVAEVPLSAEVLSLRPVELDRALAQLAWTLRQVPEVKRLRVTVDGAGLELPDGGSTVSVDGWSSASPALASASTDLFGLRGAEVYQVVGEEELLAARFPVPGPEQGSLGSLGVSITGQRFAAVSDDGTEVLAVDRAAPGDDVEDPVTVLATGSAFLRPMWDLTDRVWLVDAPPQGSGQATRLLTVQGARVRDLTPVGLGEESVVAASLSRDGTRIALVLQGSGPTQRLAVARVIRDLDGRPLRVTPAAPVATGAGWTRVRAVGWRDPATVAALSSPTADTSQVLLAVVDGSSQLEGTTPSVDVLFQGGAAMATSPGGPVALVVGTRQGRLHALDGSGRWSLDAATRGLLHPSFAG